ncbi:hypothetical protein [Geomonas propionica]|uniref:Uncharacterized protein n=1 Tax=Geomonas propionica TaxID=2798582 RepID=A0ABS0YPB9_9BACT|nr:hypothetical protein [Geomonas propionica]MBJ6799761.1 hypothetical protein [Geomonas propionica]
MTVVLTKLAAIVGPMVAQGILDRLLSSKGAGSKMERVVEAMGKGVSVIAALHGEFGEKFLNAISEVVGQKQGHAWTYEAGSSDYIKLDPPANRLEQLSALRDELNINLDRLIAIGKMSDDALMNYFRGTLSVWRQRYTQLIGFDEDAQQAFATMDQLLDGTKRNFRDVMEMISKTSLGGVGGLMVISGVLLATSTGVGLATSISIFLFGIPWASVGVLVIPGAILLGLSRCKFSSRHAMTTCIKMSYKLLEEKHKGIAPEPVVA